MRPVEQYHRRVVRTLLWLAALVGAAAVGVSTTSYILDARNAETRAALGSYHLRSLQLSAEIGTELDQLSDILNASESSHPLVSGPVALVSSATPIASQVAELARLQQVNRDRDPAAVLAGMQSKLARISALPKDAATETIRDHFDSFRLSLAQFEKLHNLRANQLIAQLEAGRDAGAYNTIVAAIVIFAASLILIAYGYRALSSSLASHVETEEALEASERRFRDGEKLRAIGQLVGGVAHDFNNLLTVINGYAETSLADDGLPTTARSAIQEILRAGTRAADLTQRLLAFSSRQPVEKRPLNLNELVPDALSMLRPLIGDHIDLSVALGQESLTVEADPSELQQVLTNLIVNARDAVSGGGTISISTAPFEASQDGDMPRGRYCRLSVIDDGRGMDAETCERIFEPFFTTKGIGEGTGLGLSMVHGIVRGCGGTINVTSGLGEGARFDVYLPRSDDAPAPSRPVSNATLRGGQETLLLVEDELQILDLTAERLADLGYTVLTAVNGLDAIEQVKRHVGGIDLIISDVIMPGVNGPEAVKEILTIHPHTHVIYMSGYTDDIVLESGATSGGAILIRKPFNMDDLARVIRASLDEGQSAVA